MNKITKRQRDALLHTLSALERVQRFIANDRTVICTKSEHATTSLHYTRAFVPGLDKEGDAKPLTAMCKEIGSELALLPDAIRTLKYVLEN